MHSLAPILLFTYNRPQHTKKVIKSLENSPLATKSNLYIFCDGIKNKKDNIEVTKNKQIKKIINSIKKEKFNKITIFKEKKNKGLAKSIIDGVTGIINKYQKVIVLEDDIVINKYFLNYMNDALVFYKKEKTIFSLSGYCPYFKIPKNYKEDLFLFYRFSSWGWATWKDRWDKIKFDSKQFEKIKKNKTLKKKFNLGGDDLYDMFYNQIKGRINSWAIYYCFNQFLKQWPNNLSH